MPDIVVETDQREAIVPLVVAGAGASTVSPSPRLVRSIGLVWRDGPLSPAARAFIDTGAL